MILYLDSIVFNTTTTTTTTLGQRERKKSPIRLNIRRFHESFGIVNTCWRWENIIQNLMANKQFSNVSPPRPNRNVRIDFMERCTRVTQMEGC